MYCIHCGRQIDDNSNFCPYCGGVMGRTSPSVPVQDPAPDPWEIPSAPAPRPARPPASKPSPKPRKGPGIVAIGAAAGAAVVAVVAAVLLFTGVLSSPKSAVGRAAVKSLADYRAASQSVGLPDLKELYGSGKFSQDMELSLVELNLDNYYYDLSALEGAGIRWGVDMDLPDQKLSASATPFYGAADLLTANLAVDGSTVCVNVPELTRDTYYGVDTMTLGRDLTAMDPDLDEDMVESISFNLFDLVEQMRDSISSNDTVKKALKDARTAFLDSIEVEKAGKETIEVNGYGVACTAYSVTVTQDALEAYLDVLEEAARDVDYEAVVLELMRAMGLPGELLDEAEAELDGAELDRSIREMFDAAADLLDLLGDIELKAYVGGGRLMAVTYTKRVDGTRLDLGVYLGGGKNYVDDFSIVISADQGDGGEYILRSSGNHSAKGGTFTDETTLSYEDGYSDFAITSALSYAPKEAQDNFYWTLEAGSVTLLNVRGQITAGKDSVAVELDEVELGSGYGESVTVGLKWFVGPYEAGVSAKSPVMLLSLSEDELLDLADDLEDSVYDWAVDLMATVPQLMNLF